MPSILEKFFGEGEGEDGLMEREPFHCQTQLSSGLGVLLIAPVGFDAIVVT